MLDHRRRPLGDVEHLPRLAARDALRITETSTALITALRKTLDDRVHATRSSREPPCPPWPPEFFPDCSHKLRFFEPARGFESSSDEPGRELVREFAANRAFNSTISACWEATTALDPSTNDATSS